MLKLILIILLLIPNVVEAGCTGPTGGVYSCSFTSGTYNGRTWRLHVPTVGSGPRPLIVILHGGGTLEDGSNNDARTVARFSADMESDSANGGNGILVAYPRSGRQPDGQYQWQIGPEACVQMFGNGSPYPCLDDVGFVNAVIQEIKNTQSVDSFQVAVAGHSGGGFIVLRMVCEAGKNPHGTVMWAISASLTGDEVANCTNSVTTRLFMIHGTVDTAVPFVGTVAYGSQPIPGVITIPVAQAAFQVIALGARQGATSGAWTDTGSSYNASSVLTDGNCFINIQHTGVNVILGAIGLGAALPIRSGWPGLNDPCYSTGGTSGQNGGGHRWPGYTGNYGIGKITTFFNLSNSIIATVTGN